MTKDFHLTFFVRRKQYPCCCEFSRCWPKVSRPQRKREVDSYQLLVEFEPELRSDGAMLTIKPISNLS
jgi:hypothetical protein